jgi:hypothetical protein
MKIIKKSLTGAAVAALLIAGAMAQDFGPAPADYRYSAQDYVESRLDYPRGARISINSDPYPVYADFGRSGEYPAWAVDITVRSSTRGRGYDGYMHYTVIFVDGEPVAFEDDIGGVEMAGSSRYASRR